MSERKPDWNAVIIALAILFGSMNITLSCYSVAEALRSVARATR